MNELAYRHFGDSHVTTAREQNDEDASIGAIETKGLLGTRSGPNENGHPW